MAIYSIVFVFSLFAHLYCNHPSSNSPNQISLISHVLQKSYRHTLETLGLGFFWERKKIEMLQHRHFHWCGGSRSIMVVHWTADQQVEQLILDILIVWIY